ncbi:MULTISPECIES: prenyltransferase [unclassified Haladaptatus]|uniref:prenyltransferase n=1 Tax=unclassified Haladaptatus TaxID=2622732 RepID=UPI0023E858EA|nr:MULTISPECIES: prenyltransferase [unclassified Haladaptatus]
MRTPTFSGATTVLAGLLPTESTLSGYLLRLSRPRFWFYLAGPVIVGAAYGADSLGALLSPVAIALFLYFLVPANVFLYGVNDIFDRDVDTENPKKADKEVRYSGNRTALAVILVSGLLGLAFVPFLPAVALGVFAVYYFLAIEYSAPPFRFKTTPLLDSVSNGLYILPAVIAYVTLAGELPPTLAIVGGWLWTMGMHTFSAIPDIEPDRSAGIRTTATALGARRTYVYCAACWFAAAVAFALVHPLLGALLVVYPLLVFGIVASDVGVEEAYWWYPAVNTVVGMVLTFGGLWRFVNGF